MTASEDLAVAADAEVARLRPLEHRLADAMRLPALVAWIVVTLVALVLCTAWHNATGAWRGLEVDGVPFWRTPWQLEIVFALILGYVFACGSWIVRSVRRDLDALAPALAIDPSELATERARIGVFSLPALLAASAAGIAVGVTINVVVNAILPPGSAALNDLSWRFVRDVAIWTLSIRLIVVIVGSSLRVSRLSERAARIDLLDLRGLAPLARIGLRSAFAFALAASMIVAMSGDEQAISVTLTTVAIVGAVGAIALLLPVRGANRAIRAVKRAELAAVRAAIARTRTAALAGHSQAPEEMTRLGGLLALESRIADVSEWPFDAGTFVRLVAFIALPLASWTAAALVAWVVTRLMG